MEHNNPTHIPTHHHNHPTPSLPQAAAGCPAAAAATGAAPTAVTITASLSSQRLMRAEQSILDRLGGTPWKASRATRAQVAEAETVWNNLRTAVGFQASTTGWFTTSQTSPKMVKNNYPTVGVTMHPHKKALGVWLARTPAEQDRIAAALGVSTAEVLEVLGHSVCPFSTPGCRCGCVTGESANAKLERSDLTRLNRTLFLELWDPRRGTVLEAGPAQQVPVISRELAVRFTAGPTGYELTGARNGAELEVDAEGAVVGTATIDFGRVPLSPEQHILIVAMYESKLRTGSIEGNSVVAARLGWTANKFNRKLDTVCDKFTRAGVRGLQGRAGELAEA
ncbi:MAG: hypothetical protein ACKO5A_06725 [Actinomycetota bacterium]